MIKRTDKNKEKQFTILKVMENKDYLAIDRNLTYYILSPIYNKVHKSTALLKSKFNQQPIIDNHILTPNSIIEMESIQYYIVHLGNEPAVSIRSIDQMKIQQVHHQLNMLQTAITKILKRLLICKETDIKEYLNIRNFIVRSQTLYFLLLPRPRSHLAIKRSQKYPQEISSYQQYALNQYLQNQLSIIKEFGIILSQIFIGSNLIDKNNAIKKSINELIQQMMRRQVTYQYIQMKLDEIKIKKSNHWQKKMRIHSRQLTYSMSPDNKSIQSYQSRKVQRVQLNLQSPHYHREQKIVWKRRTYTTNSYYEDQINTSKSQKNKLVLTESNAYGPSSPKNQLIDRWRSKIQKTNTEKKRQKQWLSHLKFQTSFQERIKKQNEIARDKFMISVQKNQSEEVSDDKFKDESYFYSKLQKKLTRLKTQYQRQQIPVSKLYQNLKISRNQEDVNIARKLNFEVQPQLMNDKQTKRLFTKENEFQIQTTNTFQKMKQAQNIQMLGQFQLQDSSAILHKSKNQPENLNLQRQQSDFIASPSFSNIECKQHAFKPSEDSVRIHTNKAMLQENNAASVSPTNLMQSYLRQSMKPEQPKKSSKIHPLYPESDEIQVITVDWNIEKEYLPIETNNFIKPKQQNPAKPISTSKPKLERSDPVLESFNEYLNFINILGNICVKSVKNKNNFSVLDWRKPIYFIYERFCFERQRIVKCLDLGACQVFRKDKKINYEEWQEWLQNAKKTDFIRRLQTENKKIREDLSKFASKVLQTSTINAKVQNYIKNRQKILQTDDKQTRYNLSKLLVGTVIQLYDDLVDKKIKTSVVICFLIDCLFAIRIVCQLDNVGSPNLRIKLDQYESYRQNVNEIRELIEEVYRLYFKEDVSSEK